MKNENVHQHIAIHGYPQQSAAPQLEIQNNALSHNFIQGKDVHDTVGAIDNAAGLTNSAVNDVINVDKQTDHGINLNFHP
jgi:hypothetical protein